MRRLSDTSRIIRGLSAASVAAFAAVLILLITLSAGREAQEVSDEAEPELTGTSLYEIPQDDFDEIRAAAEELITDRVVSVHMMGVEITGLYCDGWCLVEADEAGDEDSGDEDAGDEGSGDEGAGDGGFGDVLCVIYTVDMDADVPEYGVEDSFSFYTYVKFGGVEIGADGTLRADPEQASVTYTEYKHAFDTTSSSTPVIYGYYHGYGTMGELIAHIEESGTITNSYIFSDMP